MSSPYHRALSDPHIHEIARELNEMNRVFPSEPCPHPTPHGELVGGDGKTYLYCTKCGQILRAK